MILKKHFIFELNSQRNTSPLCPHNSWLCITKAMTLTTGLVDEKRNTVEPRASAARGYVSLDK